MKLTLEILVDAIRGGTGIEELQRMVGPSAQDLEASNKRLARIDALDAKCEWESMTPSSAAQQARKQRESIVAEQGAFENAYC